MSNITILVGSMRKDGNTEKLVEAFANGAGKKNNVEIISVREYKVNSCIGCNKCYTSENHQCFQKDHMTKIYEILEKTDILVIASPVYFYGISSQLKAIIDRLHTPMRNNFKIKKTALLLVGAASIPDLFNGIQIQYDLIIDFFKLEDLGRIMVSGVKDKGDIVGNPQLEDAYNLGMKI